MQTVILIHTNGTGTVYARGIVMDPLGEPASVNRGDSITAREIRTM